MIQGIAKAVYAWLGRFGDVLTAGGLVLGAACLCVAIRIYQRQKREAEIAHDELKAFLMTRYEALLKDIGQTITPEVKVKLEQFAEATATTIVHALKADSISTGAPTLGSPTLTETPGKKKQ